MIGRIFIAMLAGLVLTGTAIAQDIRSPAVVGEYSLEEGGFEIEPDARQLLSESGLAPDDAEDLMDWVREYQSDKGEGLGVALGIDTAGKPTLNVTPGLNSDEVILSEEFLRAYRLGEIRGGLSDDTIGRLDKEKILDDIRIGLSDDGAFEFSNSIGSGRPAISQSVDPIDIGIANDDLDFLKSLCSQGNTNCPSEDGLVNVDGVDVNPAALLSSINISAPADADLQRCANAQKRFRDKVEFDERVSANLVAWRDIRGTQDIAAEFDAACLTDHTGIPPDILVRLGVFRQPDIEAPFCTGFLIAPDQILTALHCFHDRNSGKPRTDRMNDALFYLYTEPDVPLELVDVPRDLVPDTHAKQNREIPSKQDLIVVELAVAQSSIQPVKLDVPVLGNRLIVPGYFFFADRRNTTVDHALWKSEIRATRDLGPGYCRVYDQAAFNREGCLIHRCQVTPGFSGSPVLQLRTDGNWGLIGVHVRGAAEFKHHCPRRFSLGGNSPLTQQTNIASIATSDRFESTLVP